MADFAIHRTSVYCPQLAGRCTSEKLTFSRSESEMVCITFKKLYLLGDITMQVYRYIRRQE
ncbi:hypothetical protein AG1IA_09393 [Rhizoctonia solani AG-1 IA]|uniref:Uncharacterized protein n=1 Tax=Thanatephorus cucumeris (strain AG1-IA) TaxID=983506 RepID=L8WIE8_THACA|nr:hypothetical protein AG1IA_09393 [Rhizoctonia solani AG-1 IA]